MLAPGLLRSVLLKISLHLVLALAYILGTDRQETRADAGSPMLDFLRDDLKLLINEETASGGSRLVRRARHRALRLRLAELDRGFGSHRLLSALGPHSRLQRKLDKKPYRPAASFSLEAKTGSPRLPGPSRQPAGDADPPPLPTVGGRTSRARVSGAATQQPQERAPISRWRSVWPAR